MIITTAAEVWAEVHSFSADVNRDAVQLDLPDGWFFKLAKRPAGIEIHTAGFDGILPKDEALNFLFQTVSDYQADGRLIGTETEPDAVSSSGQIVLPGFSADEKPLYNVGVYSPECGTDALNDYPTIRQAQTAARKALLNGWESAGIYEYGTRRVLYLYNWTPENPIFAPDCLARSTPQCFTVPSDTVSRYQLAL